MSIFFKKKKKKSCPQYVNISTFSLGNHGTGVKKQGISFIWWHKTTAKVWRQTPWVQRDATTWVVTTNTIITPSGKKCGWYTLTDLTNNNKYYHNFRVGRRCLRAFGSCFEEGEEVFEWKFTLYCFSLIFVKGRKEGKYRFNTGLLNSTSPRGNLRLGIAANLRGPVLHHINHRIAKQVL